MVHLDWIVEIGVAAVLGGWALRRQRRAQKAGQLADFAAAWGQPSQRTRDFELLAEFHRASGGGDAAGAGLDEPTWRDLDMAAVFAEVERTLCTAGECVLYRMLHQPLVGAVERARRSRIIRVFESDSATREALQATLMQAGRGRAQELVALLWTDPPTPPDDGWMYGALAALSLAALAEAVVTRSLAGVLAVLSVYAVNAVVHYREQRKLGGRLGGLRQLGVVLDAARRAAELGHPELAEEMTALRDGVKATRKLKRRIGFLLTSDGGSAPGDLVGPALDYINIFFLHEVRTFYSALAEIAARQQQLRELFLRLGELDALRSVADYRAGLAGYVEPEFCADGPRLELCAARHPLLRAAVPNSIAIVTAGIALTGSNMSGKTTFLRTVALNVLLGQTIVTCTAERCRGREFRVLTAMNESDSLADGKSYYLAEAERLLTLVRQCGSESPVLALVDEPLAGTNSPERQAASRAILQYMAGGQNVVMASTHDVALVARLAASAKFAAYHFSDGVADGAMVFDYRLRAGLDYHANALQVLEMLGYPAELVADARAALLEVESAGLAIASSQGSKDSRKGI